MPTLVSKRKKELVKLVEKSKVYSLKEAIKVLKDAPKTKFDQSVDLQCKLGVDLTAKATRPADADDGDRSGVQ